MTEQTETVTFNDLCEREPELLALWFEVSTCSTSDPLGKWYGPSGFKERLCHLVGWFANSTDPVMTTSGAYDTAYHTLLDAMPRRKRGKK